MKDTDHDGVGDGEDRPAFSPACRKTPVQGPQLTRLSDESRSLQAIALHGLETAPALDPPNPQPVEVSYQIRNTDRAFGATLAGELAVRRAHAGPCVPIKI